MPQPAPLTENEIAYYYSLLTEEITSYDCGKLCSPKNGGIPFCCITDNAVPFLYKAEFTYLARQTDMWSKWKPVTKQDKKLKSESETKETFFCSCKGVAHCQREFRSISCRTFPLEPYFDERGVYTGLVFMNEFAGGCPLSKRQKDIRQEFIDQHFIFWEKLLLRREDERDTYMRSSRSLRLKAKKNKIKLYVFLPSHALKKN